MAHNGSLIPVPVRDIMVQGGNSVWDCTGSARPKEIAYWERGPLATDKTVVGGSWPACYYNGHSYSSDIRKGLDVLDLADWWTLPAKLVRYDEFNAQTQPKTGWW